jgi:hypothetical protein
MAEHEARRHVEIAEDGRLMATADIEPTGQDGVVRAFLHVESGHLPPGTRSRLVDAVLDTAQVKPGDRLEATVPMGDGEILQRVRERCDDVATRPAGATILVEASPREP